MPDKDMDKAARARSFWSGTIAFGLVSVPVSLYPANRPRAVSLKMVDRDGTPLRRRYYCPRENKPVEREELVRGYETGDDEYVVVEDEELEALEPDKTREIDLKRFVRLDEVNPVYFERAYYLAPEGNSSKAYRLLAATMEKSGRAGIATFVMRDKAYLIAILAEDGILRAETLRFHDEVRSAGDVGLPEKNKPPADRVERFRQAIEEAAKEDFDPELLRDRYAQRLRSVVDAKLEKGQGVVPDQTAEPEDDEGEEPVVIDLMAVLKDRFRQSREEAGDKRRAAPADLGDKSRRELYQQAQNLDIPGRSKMNREELIQSIRKAS